VIARRHRPVKYLTQPSKYLTQASKYLKATSKPDCHENTESPTVAPKENNWVVDEEKSESKMAEDESQLQEEALAVNRRMFLRILCAMYYEQHEEHSVSAEALGVLLGSIDFALDNTQSGLLDIDVLLKEWLARAARFQKHKGKNRYVNEFLAMEENASVNELLCYVDAHQRAAKLAQGILGPDEVETVLKESEAGVAKAEEVLRQRDGSVVSLVSTYMICKCLLDHEMDTTEKWIAKGVIDTRDAHDLAEVVEKDEGKLLEVVIKKFKEHVQDMCNA
jgi:hypothetical protein